MNRTVALNGDIVVGGKEKMSKSPLRHNIRARILSLAFNDRTMVLSEA
jgi:hypothetical protein